MFVRQFGFLTNRISPCPTCRNDGVANDGVRDGVCFDATGEPIEGPVSCDANSFFSTLPAGSAGEYTSLDCQPSGPEPSGGITIRHILTTGSSVLGRAADCSHPTLPIANSCHCGVCSNDNLRACSHDGDCSGEGRCQPTPEGFKDSLNVCGDGICTPIGDGLGECLVNEPVLWCDGALTESGVPYLGGCSGDGSGCVEGVADGEEVSFGECTIELQPKCVVDDVELVGRPGIDVVRLVSVRCGIAAVSTVNFASGLPGPALLTMDLLVQAIFPGER